MIVKNIGGRMSIEIGAWRYRDGLWEYVSGVIYLDIEDGDTLDDLSIKCSDEWFVKLIGALESNRGSNK
jgi:hypothetical protein